MIFDDQITILQIIWRTVNLESTATSILEFHHSKHHYYSLQQDMVIDL